jgi:hypothetical protein
MDDEVQFITHILEIESSHWNILFRCQTKIHVASFISVISETYILEI